MKFFPIDLHSFENRLVEIIQNFESKTKRWRWIFTLSLVLTIITAAHWLIDVETVKCSLWQSLYNHYWFTISCLILISLFLFYGIHKRVTQQDIIVNRIRYVVGQFNMGCDNQGRLILMPRPASFRYQNNDTNKQQKSGITPGNDNIESPPSSLNLLHSPLYGPNGFR